MLYLGFDFSLHPQIIVGGGGLLALIFILIMAGPLLVKRMAGQDFLHLFISFTPISLVMIQY
jgi:hypothetical protein